MLLLQLIQSLVAMIEAVGSEYVDVVHVNVNHKVTHTDFMVSANTTLGQITVFLPPSSEVEGRVLFVYDEGGWSGVHPISIAPDGNDIVYSIQPDSCDMLFTLDKRLEVNEAYTGAHLVSDGKGGWNHWLTDSFRVPDKVRDEL